MIKLNTKDLTTKIIDLSVEEIQIEIHGKKALVANHLHGEAWHDHYVGEIGTIVRVDEVDDEMKMLTLYFSNREKDGETLIEESFFEEELILIED